VCGGGGLKRRVSRGSYQSPIKSATATKRQTGWERYGGRGGGENGTAAFGGSKGPGVRFNNFVKREDVERKVEGGFKKYVEARKNA